MRLWVFSGDAPGSDIYSPFHPLYNKGSQKAPQILSLFSQSAFSFGISSLASAMHGGLEMPPLPVVTFGGILAAVVFFVLCRLPVGVFFVLSRLNLPISA